MCRAMSRAVLIILHLMTLDFRQDGTRARSFLIHVLEYTALTVQLYWDRKEAPTSASETLWTNTHTCCGYTDLPMSNHLSTDVYLQMVRVRRVCASLLILFALASLSVYRSLTAVGILHIRAVSHQSVTYGSFSWRNQFVLSQSQGQLRQAFRCTCTSVRKGLRAEQPGRHGGAFLQGLIISFLVCPAQAEMLDLRVRVG